MEGAYKYFQDFTAALESGAISLENLVRDFSVIGNIDFITDPNVLSCRTLMFSPGFQKFLKEIRSYSIDLIIFDVGCEAFYGLSTWLGSVPYIVATAYGDPFNILETTGLYDNPSYVPSPFTLFQPQMNFKERIINCFYKLYYYYRVHALLLPDQQALAQEIFGKSVGDIDDLVSNIGLVLYTNHWTIFGAKPLPPAIISIAGFHIEPPKSLPKVNIISILLHFFFLNDLLL